MKTIRNGWLRALSAGGSGLVLALMVLPASGQLSERLLGEALVSKHGCVACHDGGTTRSTLRRHGPDLSEVWNRLRVDGISEAITQHAPGLRIDAGEAKALTQFLAAKRVKGKPAPLPGDPARGDTLYHQVGCVACHEPAKADTQNKLKTLVAARYDTAGLADFLFQPLHSRPSGRMPDMGLSRQEAADIASFLAGPQRIRPALEADAKLIQQGAALFEQKNCAACHDMPGDYKIARARALNTLGTSPKFCMALDYDLAIADQKRIDLVLDAAPALDLSPVEQVELDVHRFQCGSCHQRGNLGGVTEAHNPFFTTSEPGLGDPARIPPPLTDAGAKLQTAWMHRVLFDGERARHYMHTRMPQFGEANLGHLPAQLALVDGASGPDALPEPGRDQRKTFREAGHQLMGDKGLACITCHNFNGHLSPGMKGIDLINTPERLRPDWLFAFLKDPAAHRPGILMQSYWPGGKATRTDILDGDTDKQLEAIYHYLALGRSARTPSGIRSEGHKLAVTDTPRLYRGRSRVAGYRGIAVGYPGGEEGGMNYAFNAETGAYSAIWFGEFVTAGWNSQGAGDFNPAGRALQLPKDLGIVKLARADAAWPLLPVMTREKPVNPDPLYAPRHGYQFDGYRLGPDGTPILLYRVGDNQVLERSDPLADGRGLRRNIRVKGTRAGLFLRPLAGPKIETLDPRTFKMDRLTLRIPKGAKARVRPFGSDKQELLIDLASADPMELEYELDD